MLTVGVVHLGAATEYYLASVAQGVEDYYLGEGEAPGAWYGLSAAAQGLTGQVDEDSFRAIAAGLDPTSGDARTMRPGKP